MSHYHTLHIFGEATLLFFCYGVNSIGKKVLPIFMHPLVRSGNNVMV